MATLMNVNIPQSLDGIAYEGGYYPGTTAAGTKELDSITTASSTTYGPLRVVTSALNGIIALSSPPSQTNAGSNTALTFSSQIRHLMIQNNTTANVQFTFEAAATAGSPVLTTGSVVFFDLRVTVVGLLTTAAQYINGTTAGNIIVWGWV